MMKEILWTPSDYHLSKSNIIKFREYLNQEYDLSLSDYDSLYDWSISNTENFWYSISVFTKIIFNSKSDSILDAGDSFLEAKWFNGYTLNYAENLLKYKDDQVAIEYFCEDKLSGKITYIELYEKVRDISNYLRKIGIKKGDVIAGFLPNIPETVVAMLATSSIGAIWTACSPDFGLNGIFDRFNQSKPKVLFVTDGYYYKGKKVDLSNKINKINSDLKSIQNIIYIPLINSNKLNNFISWYEIEKSSQDIIFEYVPFSHPLYIMYSSGTTGKPKSIVHSCGGTLIQHLKELVIHTDLKRKDKFFYFTTCGWMMWNWLVSGLSVGSTIVLFDGNPFYPTNDYLLKIASTINISVFGTSAKYISHLEHLNVKPNELEFNNLRTILSTGSPLVEENYEYVYKKWSDKVQLSSISGGTDIISCFALGNPIKPVKKGLLQSIGLGMNVKSFDEYGKHNINQKGELVCISPFPSMPVFFLNDNKKEMYKKAYFKEYKNIWRHGDFISIDQNGMVKIFGRSDTTLNPGGVRIGTAEIYRAIDKIDSIDDSVVVGFNKDKKDEVIILFVKLYDCKLDDVLVKSIKDYIRMNCSPRHVPYKIFEVKEIPYTINGKKVELAVKYALEGADITNKDALSNPDCLKQYESFKI